MFSFLFVAPGFATLKCLLALSLLFFVLGFDALILDCGKSGTGGIFEVVDLSNRRLGLLSQRFAFILPSIVGLKTLFFLLAVISITLINVKPEIPTRITSKIIDLNRHRLHSHLLLIITLVLPFPVLLKAHLFNRHVPLTQTCVHVLTEKTALDL